MTSALLDAMRVASESGDPDDRLAIYRALSRSEVFVPLLTDEELMTVTGRDGHPVGVAFTDLDAFRNWRSDGAWGSLYGHELAEILLSGGAHGLIVNVHGPFGGELGRQELDLVAAGAGLEVKGFADGVAHLVVEGDASVKLRVSSSFPDRLRDIVLEAARGTDGIAAVYPLRLEVPGPPRLAIGVSVDAAAAPSEVVGHLSGSIRTRLGSDETLDVIVLSAKQVEFLRDATPLLEG